MQELHIQRKIGTATVTVHITDAEVGVSTPMDAYFELLLEEMGSPAAVMTQAGLRKKLLEAAERLHLKMKTEVKPFSSLIRR